MNVVLAQTGAGRAHARGEAAVHGRAGGQGVLAAGGWAKSADRLVCARVRRAGHSMQAQAPIIAAAWRLSQASAAEDSLAGHTPRSALAGYS